MFAVEPGVGPSGIRTTVVPPAGISQTVVWSNSGNGPGLAATSCWYGSVVGTHSGCGSTVGTPAGIGIAVSRVSRLLSIQKWCRPFHRSRSNRPMRPWLTVTTRSALRGPGSMDGSSVRSCGPPGQVYRRTAGKSGSPRPGRQPR